MSRPRLLLTALIAALYIVFATRTYYWDGVLFSLYIEKVASGEFTKAVLFHPNHLFYNAVGFVFYRAVMALGFHGRALTVLQGLNIVSSIATASLLYFVASMLTASRKIALFALALFAFGATWWKFSTDANSYILSVLFATAAIYLLLSKRPLILVSAVCFVTAMAFHELAVFTAVPACCALLLNTEWPVAKRWLVAASYVGGSACAILLAYAFAYSQIDHVSSPTLFGWILTQSKDWQPGHSALSIVGSYLSSYVKLFVGGRYTLVRSLLSLPIYLGFAICLGALALAVFLARRPQTEVAITPDRRARMVLLSWFVAYAVFLAWWEPGAAFHKLYLWPPAVLLIAMWIARSEWRRGRIAAFSTLVAAIAAWNFAAFIYPHAQPSADPVLRFAQTLNQQLPQQTTVYYAGLDSDDWYLEYFAPGRNWLHLPARSNADWLRNTIASARAPVCFETSAIDRLDTEGILRSAALATGSVQRWNMVNPQHRIRFECFTP